MEISKWLIFGAGISLLILSVWWANNQAYQRYHQYCEEGYYRFNESIYWMGYRLDRLPSDPLQKERIKLTLIFKILPEYFLPSIVHALIEEHQNMIRDYWVLEPAWDEPRMSEVWTVFETDDPLFYFYLSIEGSEVVFVSNENQYPDTRWISNGWVQQYVDMSRLE